MGGPAKIPGAGGQCLPARTDCLVYEDGAALAAAAAALVVAEAQRVVRLTGRFTLALAGGSTPRATYEALAQEPHVGSMPWAATHVFWSDERCVPRDDPRSNEGMARKALLDHVPIPEDQVHPILSGEFDLGPGEHAGEAAERAAAAYGRMLRATFPGPVAGGPPDSPGGLDLVLLGLGEDGHTASLFPGSAAAGERHHWAASAFPDAVAGPGDRAVWRVTLTAPFLNLAGMVLFLVQGESKAEAVQKVFAAGGDAGSSPPASLIRPLSGRVLWLLDKAAAADVRVREER